MTREDFIKFWTEVTSVVLTAFADVSDELGDLVNEAKGKSIEEQKGAFCDIVDAVVENIVSRMSDEDLAEM